MHSNCPAFAVFGIPQPQGSTRAFTPKGWKRPIITTDNKKLKPWRQDCAQMAIQSMQGKTLITGPCSLRCIFYFEKPKSTKKSVMFKTTKPDLDKLARAVGDALTGIVFADDSQVVELLAIKQFGLPARTEITVHDYDRDVESDATPNRKQD